MKLSNSTLFGPFFSLLLSLLVIACGAGEANLANNQKVNLETLDHLQEITYPDSFEQPEYKFDFEEVVVSSQFTPNDEVLNQVKVKAVGMMLGLFDQFIYCQFVRTNLVLRATVMDGSARSRDYTFDRCDQLEKQFEFLTAVQVPLQLELIDQVSGQIFDSTLHLPQTTTVVDSLVP